MCRLLTNIRSEAQARRGEEPDVDPEQFQDPDNEYGLFAGTTYEADDEEPIRFTSTLTKQWTRAGVHAARHGKRLNWRSTAQSGRNFSNSSPI